MGFPRTSDRQNLSKKIRMTLTLIFSAFTFCYIYILQPDLLSYLQHLFSHGLMPYIRLSRRQRNYRAMFMRLLTFRRLFFFWFSLILLPNTRCRSS